ncbi:MAG: dockerin type I domain-containing protein [Terriglobia bacterium]
MNNAKTEWTRGAVGKGVLALVIYALGALPLLAQCAPTYTCTQITNDPTNHESPSINDKGQIVWSQLTPVGSSLLWQVYERDMWPDNSVGRNASPTPQRVPVPDPNHNFQYPVIDNTSDIVYLKDQSGGGAGLQVVENRGGSEAIIEFSTQNLASARIAGKHFGISSTGTIISYYDFCQLSCIQIFDVSGNPSIQGSLIDYFVPDINDNGTFAFVYNHQVCTAPTTDPVNSRDCSAGSGDLPRITNPELLWDPSQEKVIAKAEVVYINGGQVISTVGGTIDDGIWADVNDLGMIVYEKTDSSGFNQIYLATPYWQQCHGKPGHWGADTYDASNMRMCSWGCLTTALARALAIEGVSAIPETGGGSEPNDPGSLNVFMGNHQGDYVGSKAKPVPTTEDVGSAASRLNLKFNGGLEGETWDPANPTSASSLKAVADLESTVAIDNHPVIVYVTSRSNPPTFPGHFVLVTGIVRDPSCSSYNDGTFCVDFLISDPAGSPSDDNGNLNQPSKLPYTTLSQYGKFGIRGFVQDPEDNSDLFLGTEDEANLLVVDPAGQRTGLDPSTGTVVKEIPASVYYNDLPIDDEDIVDVGHVFGPPTSTGYSVDIPQPLQGTYTIVVQGLQTSSYNVIIRAFSQDGSPQPAAVLQGNVEPGSTSTTTVQFDATPGSTPTMTPMPGDRNGDGLVDCNDVAIVKASFGKKIGQAGFDPRADVNADGIINIFDLATVAKALPAGTKCP